MNKHTKVFVAIWSLLLIWAIPALSNLPWLFILSAFISFPISFRMIKTNFYDPEKTKEYDETVIRLYNEKVKNASKR